MDQSREWALRLLDAPDGSPYAKYEGAHWRLVELADLAEVGVRLDRDVVRPLAERVLGWAAEARETHVVTAVRSTERPRLHASIPGNVVFASTVLGFGPDPRVQGLVDVLLGAQWPDGGWNCDRHPEARRSSFHETVTPAIGLAALARSLEDAGALRAATRAAELLLEHRLFRRHGTGGAVHPSWVKLHHPPYWHYDVLQGLRLVEMLGLLDDPRAADAVDVLAAHRQADGEFDSRSWASSRYRSAVDYGRGAGNAMLRIRAGRILAAAGRPSA